MKITDLRHTIGGFTLHIPSLSLPPRRVYGLIGANGCGKTTLLNLLAGIIRADTGIIDYEGLSPRDITHAPRRPYMLHGSVYDNLLYPLTLRGIRPDGDTAKYWLKVTGLDGARYAPGLSGGEQQKLALARAMIFSPALILADEAFSNMDMESMDTFERIILERQQSNPVTWLLCSHQLGAVRRLCDYVFYMDDGTIITEGSVRDIFSNPQPEALRRYLRHEALNDTD